MAFNKRFLSLVTLVVLAGLPLLYGCDAGTLQPPTATDAMFSRYVSIGNSITAGYQSAGINENTQAQAYPVLVAERMGLDGTEFRVPYMNYPGCPAPLANMLTGDVIGTDAQDAVPCWARSETEEFLSNVAVPGAAVIDLISNLAPTSDPNTLTSFILGGQTQLQAARAANPSFVSVWIGNNDWLGAAFRMDASLATDATTFAATYTQVTDSLVAMGVEEGILIGVVDIHNGVGLVPHFSAGQFYMGLQMAGQLPLSFTVAPSCAPSSSGGVGDQTFVPFGYGFGVLADSAMGGHAVTLDCSVDAQVLTLTEVGQLGALVAAYNDAIETLANTLDWAYWDPNELIDSLATANEIPLIPDLTDPTGAPFGDYFSLDGVHPNAAAHILVADHVVAAINAKYDMNIP